MSVAMIGPKFYAWDRNGKPLAFGKLYTYQARTNTPKDTYQSEDQAVTNTNPVILNGEGYANVYLDGSYKMVLKDSEDNEIWTSDPVTSAQATEWNNCHSAIYISPTSFKITGNVTSAYTPDRNVRLDSNDAEFSYSTIESSVFASGETTVTVKTGDVKTGLVSVCASIVGSNSLPFTAQTLYPVVGEVDFMPRLIDALSKYDQVTCLGVFPIQTIYGSIIENKRIIGQRGVTEFQIDPALTIGDVFDLGNEASIKDIYIKGWSSDPDPTDSAWFDTIDDAVAASGVGTLNAVKLRQQSSLIDRCEITNFSGWAVITQKNNVSPNSRGLDCNVINSRLYANYGSIDIPEESEYMKFLGNSITWNVIGVRKAGGNNTFTGNNIDHNRVNLITMEGANNSHGVLTGGTMNHGKFAALIADKITVGENVCGIPMFDSGDMGIYLRNSIGVNISSCNLGRTNIFCEGQGVDVANPGVNKISNCEFNLHGATYNIHRNWNSATSESDPLTPDNCVFRDNYMMEGQASRDGSNWDEVIVNDTIAPDADGFTQQQTLEVSEGGDINSRIVMGKPLDGSQYLGNGNQTGAIRIKLPVAAFNNSNCRFRIYVKTSNRLGFFIDFGAFILSGGNWGNAVINSVSDNTYKVRLGRDSGGQPLIYLGELDRIFSSTMVEVEMFSMHAGAFSESKNWKQGWEITQEITAFENVSEELLTDYIGFEDDLDLLDYGAELFVKGSLASNTPDNIDGWCRTNVRNEGSTIRKQEYTTLGNKLYIRTTQTGDGGWTAWVEKT